MIAISLAQQLQRAGLAWQPESLDFFALPDRHMDRQVFVVSDIPAFFQMLNGYPVVAFHGSSEWALDYVPVNEVVWMPTEAQLRQQLEQRIGAENMLRLYRTGQGYCCQIGFGDSMLEFSAADAETAYAEALLHALQHDERPTTREA